MTPDELGFGNRVSETPNVDGTTTILTEGIFKDKVVTTKIQIRKDIETDNRNVMKDVISCLDVFTDSLEGVQISILKDRYGQAFRIQKTWTIVKEGKPKK